jgi:hypothetical protein
MISAATFERSEDADIYRDYTFSPPRTDISVHKKASLGNANIISIWRKGIHDENITDHGQAMNLAAYETLLRIT